MKYKLLVAAVCATLSGCASVFEQPKVWKAEQIVSAMNSTMKEMHEQFNSPEMTAVIKKTQENVK